MCDLSRSEIEHLIEEWVFSERDKNIMKRRIFDGVCFEPLAEEFELSTRHIKRIVYKYIKIIERHVSDS